MFLRVIPNPHDNGRMTRTVTFEAAPGQTYAIDAERLHATPALLNEFQTHISWALRAMTALAYIVLAASIAASFYIAPWLWVPGVIACAILLQISRRSAGVIAKSAAKKSNAAMFYLHSIGAMWLVLPAAGIM